jgi:hypothetical protein
VCITYPIESPMKEHLFKSMVSAQDDIDWTQIDWVGEIQRNEYLHELYKENCMKQLAIDIKNKKWQGHKQMIRHSSGKINIRTI